MNNDSNCNNNNMGSSNSNYDHRMNDPCWRGRNGRYNRQAAKRSTDISRAEQTMTLNPVEVSQPVDLNPSTSMVSQPPVAPRQYWEDESANSDDSPPHEHCSPARHSNAVMLGLLSGVWAFNANERNRTHDRPYPQNIPTLNGLPYSGGPSSSSSSPIGSWRGSTYSNASPPQVISGGSSPRQPHFLANAMNGDRRSSVEEVLSNGLSGSPEEIAINLQDSGRASNSQSPVEPNSNSDRNRRNVQSRLSDEGHFDYYSPSRSSSEDFSSLENNARDFGTPSPDTVSEVQRNGGSNGIPRCNECTYQRACNNCSTIYRPNTRPNVVEVVEAAQDTPATNQLRSVSAFALAPLNSNQSMRVANQVILPNDNIEQIALSNEQLNIDNQQPAPVPYPVPGQQLILPVPTITQPLASSSPLMFLNQRIMIEQPILYCSEHRAAQRFYCLTCSKLFCNECGPQHHQGHVTAHLLDATESAQKQAERVLTECRFGIDIINEDIERGVLAAKTVNVKAAEAADHVKNLTNQLIKTLETRQKELLDYIEAARKSKLKALEQRDEGLKAGRSRLDQAMTKLNKSVEASSLTVSPLDLIVAKDMASAQIFEVKCARHNLPPPEEHYIRFELLDTHVVECVKKLGNIVTGNGHVGDRRQLARPMIPSMTPPMVYPRSRAIAGTNYQVSITNKRRIVNNSPYYDIGKTIMSLGDEFPLEDNLCRPWGVACDKENNIVIADRSNNRIQIFRTDGQFVRRFGSHGTGRVQFDRPAGVAVDARRRIIVADKDNHRIQVLTMEGEFLLCFGEKGGTPGQFNYPWDVATNDACQIVVSDTRNHRIQLFSAEGVFLRRFGFESVPQLWKCLDSPRGVAFNNEGNVIVTDFNNHRIVVVDIDFGGAKFLGCDSLTPHPMPSKTFLRPQGVAVDDFGHIIVCDSRNHRVQILDANGVCRWRFGSQGSGPDQMDRPSGVAVTPDGKIVVVDFGNNRVLVF